MQMNATPLSRVLGRAVAVRDRQVMVRSAVVLLVGVVVAGVQLRTVRGVRALVDEEKVLQREAVVRHADERAVQQSEVGDVERRRVEIRNVIIRLVGHLGVDLLLESDAQGARTLVKKGLPLSRMRKKKSQKYVTIAAWRDM